MKHTTQAAILILLLFILNISTAAAATTALNVINDTRISSTNPDKSYSSQTTLVICPQTTCGGQYWGLMDFNVSAIPDVAYIGNATLNIWQEGVIGSNITVFAISGPWNSSVTWNTKPSNYSNHSVTITVPDTAQWNTWNITSMVRAWVNGSLPNYGFYIQITSVEGVNTLYSSEHSSVSLRPNLTINYNMDTTYISPTNGSTGVNTLTALTWRGSTNQNNEYYIATDDQYINIIYSGTVNDGTYLYTTGNLSLSADTKYYWKVKGALDSDFLPTQNFTTASAAMTPGRLNITARDEQSNVVISTFTATLYNETNVQSKVGTGGWANFSSSEVLEGEYLIRISATNYGNRSILASSPDNVTVYLPASSNIIDTIAFYLLDYTNKFPWKNSVLSISKNNSVMHSAYFDADAKVAVYLIRGESYGVTVSKGNNIQNWGNYISIASGNVEVVIMDLGVNSTLRNPFVYNVTWSSSDIILQWGDSFDVMSNINYSIFKGGSKTLVHQLITSVDHGSSEYIVTNTSDMYYVLVSALTTNGYRNQSYIIDYRAGSSATDSESPDLYTWSYGSVVIPPWAKNAFAVMSLAILAGCFGALHRGEGAIITGIMALVFWKWTWLSAVGAGIGFLGAMVLFAILYHLDSKRKGGGYF